MGQSEYTFVYRTEQELVISQRQGTVPISTGKSEKWLYLINKGDPNIYRTEREVVIPRRRKVVRIAIGQREI